jgi:hypothetical protein
MFSRVSRTQVNPSSHNTQRESKAEIEEAIQKTPQVNKN